MRKWCIFGIVVIVLLMVSSDSVRKCRNRLNRLMGVVMVLIFIR